jgi:hypothetical protein
MAIPDGWNRNRAGRIALKRTTDFDTTVVTPGLIVIRLEYVDSRKHAADIAAGAAIPNSVQLGMTLRQADRLIASLTSRVSKFRRRASQSGALN